MGFEKTMNAILDNLPTEDRQTLLFSATQTRSVKGKWEKSYKKSFKKKKTLCTESTTFYLFFNISQFL